MLPLIAALKALIRKGRPNLKWAGLILLASWGLVRLGILVGEVFIPPGLGYPPPGEIADDLFRFDANYYLDIAQHGYVYDGDPTHAPNIVFAPLYPLVIRVAALGVLDKIWVGFCLNKLFLFLALTVWLAVLTPLGARRARLTLLALVTAAGSYSLHAYYSESLMFLAWGLMMWGLARDRKVASALGGLIAGATRLTALPLIAWTALALFREAFRRRQVTAALAAVVTTLGALAYLGYLAWAYHAEPLSLIALCQKSSWAHFHPPFVTWTRIADGYYLRRDAELALARGWATVLDIQTLNLVWMLLGLGSAAYTLGRRRDLPSLLFASYAGFIYVSNAGSEYLISAHRFMLLMLPIYTMFGDLHVYIAARSPRLAHLYLIFILALNASFGILHGAMFNQGTWNWF